MNQKSGPDKAPADQVMKDIRRQTRRQYSAEEKIVLEGLRGEENLSELCRRETPWTSRNTSRRRSKGCRRRPEHYTVSGTQRV
jgi:transposase-like protein